MNFASTPLRRAGGALALAALGLLAACERPPVQMVQNGPRGTAMASVYNPRTLVAQEPGNALPTPIPAVPEGGPAATTVFKNVKVLGDLSVGEFTRTMLAITAWVSPQQGCAYCHAEGEDLSSDKLYTKVVARKMLEMTRHINADWKPHVADTGVTCFTCHRGEPVPKQVWFNGAPRRQAGGTTADSAGQNIAAALAGLSSLPADPLTPYLQDAKPIRVVSQQALPGSGNPADIKQTEWTYALMTHMSESLGVNCTYCHNSRNFTSWAESPPQRVTAWHGIRMARDLNLAYLDPLAGVFPAQRLGPTGDVAKVSCATCHQGAYKPLYGASLLKDHPVLAVKAVAPAAPAAAAPAAPAASN